jgi:hypothetical protein
MLIRRARDKDRVLQYGTVAATLLKDIGNASNQPYLQAIASVSLLIMETMQVRPLVLLPRCSADDQPYAAGIEGQQRW